MVDVGPMNDQSQKSTARTELASEIQQRDGVTPTREVPWQSLHNKWVGKRRKAGGVVGICGVPGHVYNFN